MQRHGWVLLFHGRIAEQLKKLRAEVDRVQRTDPRAFEDNANVKLFRALSQLMLEVIPRDPTRDEYCLSDTSVQAQRYWRRAKIARRFNLFFRYDFRARAVLFAWIDGRNGRY